MGNHATDTWADGNDVSQSKFDIRSRGSDQLIINISIMCHTTMPHASSGIGALHEPGE